MPNIGVFHPQIVHFVIALACVGVAARIVSLLPLGQRFGFLGAMAATMILLGTAASVAAVQSGKQAHGPVERVPGARHAVEEHEEWGERARNALLVVAFLELAALALVSRPGIARAVRVTSGLLGLATLFVVYQAGDHGGRLVYGYAGGVGIRSGDPVDVQHLLVAGLYNGAQSARKAGRKDEAARLTAELERQMASDPTVRLLGAESLIEDRGDPRAALVALATMELPQDNPMLEVRRGVLTARAYRAAGVEDSARVTLEALRQKYADNPRVQAAIDRMSAGSR